MAEKTLLRATYDFVFKYIFGTDQNKEVLKAFLNDHLEFDNGDELADLTLKNPFIPAEFKYDKICVLDIKVETKHGKLINIEVQVNLSTSLAKRMTVYQSKAIASQLGSGDDYAIVKPVIIILILAENMFHDDVYHHTFHDYDPVHKCLFSNEELAVKHVLELKKLPIEDDGTSEWVWGKFLTTENEEVLNMLAEKNPVLVRAVDALKYVSRDEQMRADAEAREWFLMDQRVAARANAVNEVRIAKLLEEAEIERTKQTQLIAEFEREKKEQFSQLIKAEKERQEKADQLARAEKERQEKADQLARAEKEKQQQADQFAEQLARAEKERLEEAERFAQLYERIAELERLQSIK